MTQAPGPRDPTRSSTIDRGLYAETFLPAGAPIGAVVVTHGYAEHCGRYREVAHVITNAGWAVLTYDVRGHGHSPGPRGFIDRFDTYLADLAAARAAAQGLAPGKPLVLLGHSHGSLITLRALCGDRPPAAVAAVVSSPYLALRIPVPAHKRLLANIASRIAPKLAQPAALPIEDLTSDPVKQAERAADKLCFDIATARWFIEANAAQDFVASHAPRITLPTTWLVAGADRIADPAQSRRVADRVANATYRDLQGFRHEVFNEVERSQVFSQLTEALAAASA